MKQDNCNHFKIQENLQLWYYFNYLIYIYLMWLYMPNAYIPIYYRYPTLLSSIVLSLYIFKYKLFMIRSRRITTINIIKRKYIVYVPTRLTIREIFYIIVIAIMAFKMMFIFGFLIVFLLPYLMQIKILNKKMIASNWYTFFPPDCNP